MGIYNPQIGFGQEGVQVVCHRLVYTDGSSLDIGSVIRQDSHGLSDFRDNVDHHYEPLAGFAVLTSPFAAAADLATSRNRTLLTYPSPAK